jgi:hypothetical protein
MIVDKRAENGIKWKTRKKEWPIQVLIAGSTGLLGSIVTALSEMESIDLSNFFGLKVGTYFILLLWLIGIGVIAPGIWLLCKGKLNSSLDKISRNAKD